jgi:hypothetical protein
MTSCPYQACMYWYHQACMTSCPYQACMYWLSSGLYDLMSLPSMYVLVVVWGSSYELMSLPSRYGYQPGITRTGSAFWYQVQQYQSIRQGSRLVPGPNPASRYWSCTNYWPSIQLPSTYLVTTNRLTYLPTYLPTDLPTYIVTTSFSYLLAYGNF